MRKKDNSEKIKQLEETIGKSKQIIVKEQEKIKKAESDIKSLRELEIIGIINELNIPYDKLKEFLKSYKN